MLVRPSLGLEIRPGRGGKKIFKISVTKIPPPYCQMKSCDFAKLLMSSARVMVSPGIGFVPAGDEYVRFSLVQDEATLQQALDSIALMLR